MNYDDVQNSLNLLSVELEASSFHGSLTGLICIGCAEVNIDDWLPMLLSGGYVPDKEYEPLAERVLGLYREIRSEFEEDGFGFTVVLPPDDEPLEERIQSVNSWCTGFLEGLHLGGFAVSDSMPEECAEIIDDVSRIANVEMDDDESLEDQEFAFMTVSEHLRTAVQLFFETVTARLSRHSDLGVDTAMLR